MGGGHAQRNLQLAADGRGPGGAAGAGTSQVLNNVSDGESQGRRCTFG